MTANHNKTMAEYKGADFNKRLHMYLQFPQLRSEFFTIDRKELTAESPGEPGLTVSSLATRLSALLGSATSGVKKLVGVGSA